MRLREPGRLAAIICLLGLLWLPFMPIGWAAALVEIQSVTAVVQADAALPMPVQQRMEKSVQAIGEQLLEGKSQEDVRQSQKQYEDIILQVFDKVLVGYTVGAVRLEPGVDTCVHVALIPWQDKINQVHTSVTVEGMSPELAQLLYQDVVGMEEIFANSLQGLPIAAVDWTSNGARLAMERERDEHFHIGDFAPGGAGFRINWDAVMEVDELRKNGKILEVCPTMSDFKEKYGALVGSEVLKEFRNLLYLLDK